MTKYEMSLFIFCKRVGVKIFWGFTDGGLGIYHHPDKIMILSNELKFGHKYQDLFTYVLTHETCHSTRDIFNRTHIYNKLGLSFQEHFIIEELIVERASTILCDGIASHQSINTEIFTQYNKVFDSIIGVEADRIIEVLKRRK